MTDSERVNIEAVCSDISDMMTGKVTAKEMARHVVRRHQDCESLGAVQSFDTKRLLQASENPGNGALSGVPFVAKDNINTSDFPTSGGTAALLKNIPERNALVVDMLLDAGAVLAGKSALHELAFGITSNNAVTGPVRNPYNPNKIPGGSSGGTAAAVAANIVPFGLGTDTGGSCRIPAALCGVVGFRPTTGRYPNEGVVPISHTRDTVGPIAKTVKDIQLVDSILANDNTQVPFAEASGIILGIPTPVFCDDLESEVAQAFDNAIEVLIEAGVSVVHVDLGDIGFHNGAFSFPVVLYEVMRDLPAYLKKYAPKISFEMLVARIESPDVRAVFESQLGDQAITEEVYYKALDVHRPQMRKIYADAFQKHRLDGIIFPTTPLRAADIGADECVVLNGRSVPTFPTYIRNTDLGSNLGAPCISLPCRVEGELPIGIELDGALGADKHLLSLACLVEHIINPPTQQLV